MSIERSVGLGLLAVVIGALWALGSFVGRDDERRAERPDQGDAPRLIGIAAGVAFTLVAIPLVAIRTVVEGARWLKRRFIGRTDDRGGSHD